DEPLSSQRLQVAPDGDLRDRKGFRKFRNRNGIPDLEQPQDVLHALGLREIAEIDSVVDAGDLIAAAPHKSICGDQLTERSQSKAGSKSGVGCVRLKTDE